MAAKSSCKGELGSPVSTTGDALGGRKTEGSMRMLRRKSLVGSLAAAVTVALVMAIAPASAHEAPTHDNDFTRVPVHGHNEAGTRKFSGHMTVKRFVVQEGNIMAVARITDGVLKNDDGDVLRRLQDGVRVKLPVALPGMDSGTTARSSTMGAGGATCDILNLVLGPLDLDLLGLQIHLNQVVLDIVAESGPGNLLGNLLCAVAGLLDGTPAAGDVLGVIRDLLNAILGVLNL